MKKIIISNHGFSLGNLSIPKFSLHEGDCITIRWPTFHQSKGHKNFISLFSGKARRNPNLDINGRIEVINDPLALIGACKSDTELIGDILADAGDTTDFIATELFQRKKWKKLPLTLKYLALIAFLSTKADCIVFNTCGLDPNGVLKCLNLVRYLRSKGTAFIYMSFPIVTSSNEYVFGDKEIEVVVAPRGAEGGSGSESSHP